MPGTGRIGGGVPPIRLISGLWPFLHLYSCVKDIMDISKRAVSRTIWLIINGILIAACIPSYNKRYDLNSSLKYDIGCDFFVV